MNRFFSVCFFLAAGLTGPVFSQNPTVGQPKKNAKPHVVGTVTAPTEQPPALPKTGLDLLKLQHERHAANWWKTLTFSQKTAFFKNDTLTKTETWYEAIQLPDLFRIDFGEPNGSRAAIWRSDSLFVIKEKKLASVRADDNDLLFLLGGLYSVSADSAAVRLQKYGYDLSAPVRSTTFKSRLCFILGDIKKGGNEIWLDQKRLLPLRILTQTKGTNDEIWLENQVRLSRGWTEGKVTFFQDGHKIQEETYNEISADRHLDEAIFDARRYGLVHWMKKK